MPTFTDTVNAALQSTSAIPDQTVVTQCQAVQGPYERTNALEEVSFLFIPFEAVGTHAKRNAGKGVVGFEVTMAGDKPLNDLLEPASGALLKGQEIGAHLPDIVQQEVEGIRNIRNPEADFKGKFDAVVRSAGKDPANLSALEEHKVTMKLKGYEDYPTVLFLSENPTKAPFPDRIDTGVAGKGYVKKEALEKGAVKGLMPVNQMAVYLREDVDQRMTIAQANGDADALYLTTNHVIRTTDHMPGESKDEHMLTATLGRTGGPSITAAGVHLRATLTGKGVARQQQELKDLQQFCEKNKIQLLMGDFNMDLQNSPQGSRGIVASHPPRFVLDKGSTEAHPEVVQQFSSSTGEAHYMGLYKADTMTMGMVGTSMYGPMGASGSRSLRNGDKYYSDHPSVYVAVESREPPPRAAKRGRSEVDDEGEREDLTAKRAARGPSEDVEMDEG